jgi:mannose-6-phosphate isomerase-like protein (cupin superfamily)
MNSITEFKESGILELYVMGAASPEEILEVEKMIAAHPEMQQEIEEIREAIEHYAQAHAIKPRNNVKTMVMATVDYLDRMKQGELPESPPIITPESCESDFEGWLENNDAVLPDNVEGIHARIIGYTPKATTAIAWIRDTSEPEVHHDELERFLILEGSCQFTAGDKMYSLSAGDFFEVPLHTVHHVQVTSPIPCKVIIQRISIE